MIFRQQGKRGAWVVFILAIIFWGTTLAGSGYAEALRFVFMADSRGNPINTTVLNELNAKILALSPKPAYVIFAGDLAKQGINTDGSNNLQTFKDVMKSLTDAGIKLYVTVGNHELYNQSTGSTYFYLENQQLFQNVFADLPGNGPPGYEKLVYSFESSGGDAFFAVLYPYYINPGTPTVPANNIGAIDNTQLAWLSQQITQTKATHKFLFCHVPTYGVTSTTTHSSYLDMWTLLDTARFDVYFCGHTHLYSRKAIDRSVAPQLKNRVVQVINGGAGAPPVTSGIVRDPTDWHIKTGVYFYTVVDIDGSKVEVHSYGGTNGNYPLIDSFTLTRGITTPVFDLFLNDGAAAQGVQSR